MVAPIIEQALAAYRSRLESELPGRVERVVLFGSWARDEAHEESDVDVLVLLTHATFPEKAHAIDVGATVGLDLALAIAPLVMTTDEWRELERRERRLAREIDREGVER